MARKLRYRRRSARTSGGMAAGAAILMIGVFAAVALMQRAGGFIGKVIKPQEPLPTSALEAVSDIVRLAAQDYYAIQFGVYENKQAAEEKALAYVERGAAGYIWQEEGKCRVLAAVYTSLGDAQTIKERLKSQGIDTYVLTIRQPALEMRVSASETQRALLGEIFAFLQRAVREIGDISMALDKQTMSAQEAGERMTSLCEEANAYSRRTGTELGDDSLGVIRGIRALLDTISEKCGDISAQNLQEELAMTAKIKYNYLEVLWNVGNFVDSVLSLGTA